MQEAPQTSDAIGYPCRNRLYLLLAATLSPIILAITWLIVRLYQADGKIGTVAGDLFGVFIVINMAALIAYRLIPRAISLAKIEELLTEFVQVSDKFTRPKSYLHKALIRPTAPLEPSDFIYHFHAYSDGSLQMPSMSVEKVPFYESRYVACINMDEEIFHLDTEHRDYRQEELFLISAKRHYENGLQTVHVRIRRAISRKVAAGPKVVEGDFTIEGAVADAFLKTLELNRLFKKTWRYGHSVTAASRVIT
jgi:hypothetical protein